MENKIGEKAVQGKKGLVSCVTPVWNREKYIGSMLESVLGQTYPWMEMILVDDGSDDRTLEIAESYREPFAKRGYEYQIVSAPHRNASAAINQGLPLVHGEYLIWPDSDDRLEKDSVEKRVAFLLEHPECDSVRSLMYYFDTSGILAKSDEKIGDLEKNRLFFDLLEFRTFVCCGCYMLKTKEFFSVYPQRRIPEAPVGQNFQMLLPYMYRYTCHTIPERLYGVRVHPDSHSRRVLSQKEDEKKTRDYEKLIHEISTICNIRSIREIRRIKRWKWQRRLDIARRYRKKMEIAKAKISLAFYGKPIKNL